MSLKVDLSDFHKLMENVRGISNFFENELSDIASTEAVYLLREDFQNEGFTDATNKHRKDVNSIS